MPYHKKGTGLPSCYPPPQPVSQLRGTVWLFMARFGQESGAILLIHAFQVQPKTCCGYAMDSSSRHLIIMMHIHTHKQYTHSVSPSTEDENIHLFVRWLREREIEIERERYGVTHSPPFHAHSIPSSSMPG